MPWYSLSSGFDLIAPHYDRLVSWVFGGRLLHAQEQGLGVIAPRSHGLIVGGGSGAIACSVLKHCPDVSITYVEASVRMLNLAKIRLAAEFPDRLHQLDFVLTSRPQTLPPRQMDWLMTPFVLDLFSDESLKPFFEALHDRLCPGGWWIWTDFVVKGRVGLPGAWLVAIMYAFFRLVSGIEAGRLPDTARLFHQFAYQPHHTQSFLRGMVETIVYQKPTASSIVSEGLGK